MDFDFHVQNPYVPGGGEWQYAPPPFFYTNPNAMMGNPMADWFDEQMGYANSYGTIPVWQDRVCTEWQDLVHYMNRKWSHHGMVWGYINGNVKRISNMISWPNGNLPAVGIRRNLHVLFDQLRMMNGTGPQIPGLNDVLARIKRIAQRVGENPWFV